MELFAIAHEYGHHHCQHGKAQGLDSHREEFDADQFSLRISAEIEPWLPNPYLESGAGGVILLLALDTLRAVEEALGLALAVETSTHPKIRARIAKFDSVAALRPLEFARLKSFRMASERVMDTVREMIVPSISELPPDALRAISELRSLK